MEKTWNNKAWFMVIPVLVLVAFSAVIPLMTVVNYSVQDTFGNNEFFWAGTDWFTEILSSDRFWNALARNLIFSMIILAIEVPLGILIALNMPKKGIGVPVCLVLMALPLLIPWNVVGNPCTEGNIEGNLGSSKNNNSEGENGKVWCTCSDECSQRNAKEPESQCATPGHCINAVTNEWRCQTGELGNR